MERKIFEYLKELETRNNERIKYQVWDGQPLPDFAKYKFSADFGPKYIRIWHANQHADKLINKACFCFVDYSGNLYKAAGWKAPAKGIRGTLEKPLYFSASFYR